MFNYLKVLFIAFRQVLSGSNICTGVECVIKMDIKYMYIWTLYLMMRFSSLGGDFWADRCWGSKEMY